MDVVNIVKLGKLAELHAKKRLSLNNHLQNLAALELKIIDNFVDKFTQEEFVSRKIYLLILSSINT
jgi:hypothetical protein